MDESRIRGLLEAEQYRDAFEQIVEQFQTKLFHLALSMTKSHATAADLAQEALLRVWKALPSYNGTASVSTWIYTITRNVCFTELKRMQKRAAAPLHMTDPLDLLADSSNLDAGAAMDVEVLLGRLPERQQQVLRLFYLEQKSYEETAAILGQPLGTLKANLFRAKRELMRLAKEIENSWMLVGGTK